MEDSTTNPPIVPFPRELPQTINALGTPRSLLTSTTIHRGTHRTLVLLPGNSAGAPPSLTPCWRATGIGPTARPEILLTTILARIGHLFLCWGHPNLRPWHILAGTTCGGSPTWSSCAGAPRLSPPPTSGGSPLGLRRPFLSSCPGAPRPFLTPPTSAAPHLAWWEHFLQVGRLCGTMGCQHSHPTQHGHATAAPLSFVTELATSSTRQATFASNSSTLTLVASGAPQRRLQAQKSLDRFVEVGSLSVLTSTWPHC